jgi:hypothetical protein
MVRSRIAFSVVIAGLDPAIHHQRKKRFSKVMDARVKPGHDSGGTDAISFKPAPGSGEGKM